MAPLAAAEPDSAAIAAVGETALAMSDLVAAVLQENSDDLVAVFQGTYNSERLDSSRDEHYDARGASIDLSVRRGGE